MKTAIIFLILVSSTASAVRSERKRSKAYFTRGKRQNALNANWNSGQQQQHHGQQHQHQQLHQQRQQQQQQQQLHQQRQQQHQQQQLHQQQQHQQRPQQQQVHQQQQQQQQRQQQQQQQQRQKQQLQQRLHQQQQHQQHQQQHTFSSHPGSFVPGSSFQRSSSTNPNSNPELTRTRDSYVKELRRNTNKPESERIPKMTLKGSRKSIAPPLVPGSKRTVAPVRLNSPLAAAAAADVQGAVVEKGIEVMGQMVDKQLKIIDEAQDKAENFLKKEIKLDIVPDKGWQSEDMFVPPGYHLDSTITDDAGSPKEAEQAAFTYPAGLGNVLMNGCYGTGYKEGDPCYVAKWTLDACLNMIDGAAFMGVGFDGRGEYSPESRKMSIVQRSCAGKATYDDYDVPDTMNVHGIYDTKAGMVTFESRSEFQSHLQQEAGVSGSYFGFYAGVKSAWGESSSGSSQQYMAQLSVDINRYEVFLDEVKPHDLSLSFLREFMDLPTSYFAAGAPLKYQDFIQRWGTHYIKSSKFGGQLQIRKFMDANDISNKKEFAVEMEMEFKTLFSSVGAKSSTSGGEYSRNQTKTTSTTIIALGGSHEIASILSDAYSPTFKNEFKDWLVSIPKYPKPFLFQVGSITNLVNFRMKDLFPDDKVDWGCEGHAASLTTEKNANGDSVTYFQAVGPNGTMVKHYCMFDSRKGLEEAIKRRRISLKRAIEVYMEEGPTSISDFNLPECTTPTPAEAPAQADLQKRTTTKLAPAWQKITSGQKAFRVIFDMKRDLTGIEDYSIPRNMSRLMKYTDGKWLTGEEDGSFHLYNAFNNGGSGDARKHKVSILGLVLSYNQKSGGLELLPADLEASKQFFPDLHEFLSGRTLATIAIETEAVTRVANKRENAANPPCNVKWSNALRFDPTDSGGKCLHFTAATEGSLFVVFSTLPKDKTSWYYTEITPERVAIYKGDELKTSTTNANARGLGDPNLLQSYFVCVTESESSTLIEYGKTLGTTESGDIYLNMLDISDRLNVRFYAFGNGDKKLDVIDAHIVPRDMTDADCKGDTHMDLETRLCTQKCHEDCDPLHGCNTRTSGNPLPTECNVCRVAKDLATDKCLPDCNEPNYLTPNKICIDQSGTFDLELGTNDLSEQLSVRQIPRLPLLTMCLWLRFLETYSDLGWRLIDYSVPGTRAQTLTFLWAKDGVNRMGMYVIQWAWTGESYTTQDRIHSTDFGDTKWHHMCVTISGESGVITTYLDGHRAKSETGIVQEFGGGGTLTIGEKYPALPYQITGFNLWDRILPAAEIGELATSCLKGIGNVKHWLEFSDKAKEISALKINAPSICIPPARPAEEPTESSQKDV